MKIKRAAEAATQLVVAKEGAAISLPQAAPKYLKMQLECIATGQYDLNPKKMHFWLGWCLASMYATGLYTAQEVLQVKRDHYDDPGEDAEPLPAEVMTNFESDLGIQ